jgi:hypothetical protein
MREKTILQGLGYMMGFGVPVRERKGEDNWPKLLVP